MGIYKSFAPLFFSLIVFALFGVVRADDSGGASYALKLGPYFPVSSIPGKLDPEHQYKLNTGFFIYVERFGKSFENKNTPFRKGFRIGYETLSGDPVDPYTNSSQLLKRPRRRFEAFFLSYIVQIKLNKTSTTLFVTELGAVFSFMSYTNIGENKNVSSNSFISIRPVINLGLQAGFAYQIKLNQNFNIDIGTALQLQPGKGPSEYPFSAGIILHTGISIK